MAGFNATLPGRFCPTHDRIPLNNPPDTVYLHDGAVTSLCARMNGANNDEAEGYLKNYNDPQYIGVTFTDNSIGRNALRAKVGEKPAGWLHPKFRAGIFQHLNTQSGVENVTYESNLRCLNLAGPSSTIVATLIMEDDGYSSSCDNNATSKYRAVRYNDTLLIVGTLSGLDTVPTIDRNSDTAKTIYYPCCGCVNPDSINAPGFKNVCYRDGNNNVICVFPYRSIKDIHVSDFADTTHYKKFAYSATSFGKWSWNWYKIYWPGNRTVYLDSFAIYNETGAHYDKMANHPDSLTLAVGKIEAYYNSHPNVKDQINGFYIMDEPDGAMIQTCGRIRRLIDATGAGYPKEYLTTLTRHNSAVPDTFKSKYFDTFIKYSGNQYFMFDYYPNPCYLTSNSSVHDSTSIQWMTDKYTNSYLETARMRCDAMSPPRDFWFILPSFAAYSKCNAHDCGSTQYIKTARQLTKEEMRMLVNQALIYGARGIGYWLYSGHGGTENDPNRQYETGPIEPYMRKPLEWDTLGDADFSAMLPALCVTYPACSCLSTVTYPYTYKGLVHIGANGTPDRYPHWYEIKEINQYLDSMANFFLNADWLGAGRWTSEEAYFVPGAFIDSIKSKSGYDSAFVQIGWFSKDADKYAYILNRRCDNGTLAPYQLDTQTVRIFLDDTIGVRKVLDVYQNSINPVSSYGGKKVCDLFFQPGEAKLIKLVYELQPCPYLSANRHVEHQSIKLAIEDPNPYEDGWIIQRKPLSTGVWSTIDTLPNNPGTYCYYEDYYPMGGETYSYRVKPYAWYQQNVAYSPIASAAARPFWPASLSVSAPGLSENPGCNTGSPKIIAGKLLSLEPPEEYEDSGNADNADNSCSFNGNGFKATWRTAANQKYPIVQYIVKRCNTLGANCLTWDAETDTCFYHCPNRFMTNYNVYVLGIASNGDTSLPTSHQVCTGTADQCPGTPHRHPTTGLDSNFAVESGLAQNSPNPFNPDTRIEYSLPKECKIILEIYNALGQKVCVLEDGLKAAGKYSIIWDGNDDSGAPVSSGIYFYRLVAGEFTSTKKMVIIK